MAAGLFFGYELYLVYNVLDKSYSFLQYPVLLALFILVSILLYAFPQIARYRQSIPVLLKNSILISISNIVLTIACLAVTFLIADTALHNGDWMVLIFSLYLFIGFSLSVKILSFYLRGVFRKIEEKNGTDTVADSKGI